MAKVEQYRQLIQELLLAYSEIKASNEEVEAEVILAPMTENQNTRGAILHY
ncbi:element excision factor XisI family protein [Nostoc sp. C052]|uniref:element excision factor XisI family protein n=1 Tax=Nostoc sp. C052 TaxID=2576902 RepID=UPI001C4B4018|nr:element excision factor XisI family protein [Nostoc sp. C052]